MPSSRGATRRLLPVLALVLVVLTWAVPPQTAHVVAGGSPVVRPVLGSAVLDAPVPTVVPPPGDVPAPPPPPVAVRAVDPLVIPYDVVLRSSDPLLADAAAVIELVLEDARGWQQAGYDFQQRTDAPYAIVLAEGDDAQALCQPYDVGGRFSCQNGPLVVLNAIRWREGVPHWPRDLGSYRTMLVNHEVGHLLGMHHIRCRTPGAVAPVMEQQSGTLRGCQANPWPTAIELRLAATRQFRLAPGPLDTAGG